MRARSVCARGRGDRGRDAGRRGARPPRRSGCAARVSRTTRAGRAWHDALPRLGHARRAASTPRRDRDRGVDCFYVYPTVSDQQSRLATKRVDPEIRSIALYQAARFSQLCRVYAPVYRQATVPALQAGTTTRPRLPHGLRRRRAGLRRVPAPHRPPSRLRPHRPLAGELPPAAAHPPADRRPSPPCAAGWSPPCSSAATSPSARAPTAVACSATCPRAGGRRSSPA